MWAKTNNGAGTPPRIASRNFMTPTSGIPDPLNLDEVIEVRRGDSDVVIKCMLDDNGATGITHNIYGFTTLLASNAYLIATHAGLETIPGRVKYIEEISLAGMKFERIGVQQVVATGNPSGIELQGMVK